MTLPIGLPWLGAHFRLDALASFFLVVVNLEVPQPASMVSATATTIRRRTVCFPSSPPSWPHEPRGAGGRCVFLFAVLGIHVACLLALVMAHHREPGNAKAATSTW